MGRKLNSIKQIISYILKMDLMGRAHHSGKNGLIYTDLEGITTAQQLIERVLVFIGQDDRIGQNI